MQYPIESANSVLLKIESDQLTFKESFDCLKELTGNKVTEYVNVYFENRIKQLLHDAMSKESNKLKESWLILEGIQVAICKFLYKENLKLSGILEEFAHDFDRIDDPQTQAYILERLRKHELIYA